MYNIFCQKPINAFHRCDPETLICGYNFLLLTLQPFEMESERTIHKIS